MNFKAGTTSGNSGLSKDASRLVYKGSRILVMRKGLANRNMQKHPKFYPQNGYCHPLARLFFVLFSVSVFTLLTYLIYFDRLGFERSSCGKLHVEKSRQYDITVVDLPFENTETAVKTLGSEGSKFNTIFALNVPVDHASYVKQATLRKAEPITKSEKKDESARQFRMDIIDLPLLNLDSAVKTLGLNLFKKSNKIVVVNAPVQGGSEAENVIPEEPSKQTERKRPNRNPYKLSHKEIQHQYDSAHIPSLKARVKRFACWHSCFGQFRKKAFRRPFGKSAIVNLTRPAPASKPEDDDQAKTNELGDGETKQGKRQKKSPGVTDYFNLRTKVVAEKEITVQEPSSAKVSAAAGNTPKGIASNEKGKSTKAESKTSLDVVKKKGIVESPATSKDNPKVVPKAKGGSVESGSKEENEEESGSDEASAEEDASSSEEVGEKDNGDGVEKEDLISTKKKK